MVCTEHKVESKKEPLSMSIPEYNIWKIMKKIENIESKMKDPSVYLGMYSELKELEDKFLKAVDEAEKRNFVISKDMQKQIKKRKVIIEKKRKLGGKNGNDKIKI